MKDEDMRKALGNKLKALRKQKRLTQKELAATLNIGISQLIGIGLPITEEPSHTTWHTDRYLGGSADQAG